MKKYFIFLLLISFGFQSYALSDSGVQKYKNWSLQDYYKGALYFNDSQDCVSFTSDFTGSGDLLSSLISDDQFRALIKKPLYTPDYKTQLEYKNMLQVYTPDYLGELDTLVARAMQKNFYARYVCHVGKNTDIIVGATLADARIGDILLVRKNNRIFVLPKYVTLMSQTLTGGDVGYCLAKLKTSNSFNWTCYVGGSMDKNHVNWDNVKKYTISLKNGKIIHTQIITTVSDIQP